MIDYLLASPFSTKLKSWTEIPRAQSLLTSTLLSVFFLLTLLSATHLSITYDEPEHYRYGFEILSNNAKRFDNSKMPFSALNALPGKLATALPESPARVALEDIRNGRYATMLFSVLTAFFIFHWSMELYGYFPALFTLFLYVFDPNIIAHSQLVTTDIYVTGMIVLAVYSLWRYSQRRTWLRLLIFTVVLGLAQLAKYTAIFLYPILFLILLVRDFPEIWQNIVHKNLRALWGYLGRTAMVWTLVAFVSLLIINAGFLFDHTFTPLEEYRFKSDLLQSFQTRFLALKEYPIPVPKPYLRGLDLVLHDDRTGASFGNIYLLGDLRKHGFSGYYLVAFLFKTPLAFQISILLSLWVYLSRRPGRRFLENEWFLFAPVLFFTIYFNFFYRAQIGFRFFMVVLPFLQIFCGNLLSGWRLFTRKNWMGIAALSAYLVISTLSYFPHFIPYFNELVWDRRFAYRILADSNLDWNQGSWYKNQYLSAHPAVILPPDQPAAGEFIVPANALVGITEEPGRFQWLRENFVPVDIVAYEYLVFKVTPEQVARLASPQSP